MSKKREKTRKKKDASEKETKQESLHINTKHNHPKFRFWDDMWN